jgi:hypothetical protein
MKTILQFLIIILLFTFSKSNAQNTDSTGTTLLMKSRSQIYIAQIKTKLGTQEGILYEADSNGIVILDFLYQRVSINLSEIESLKVKNLRAGKRGFDAGFYPLVTLTLLIIGPQIIIYGLPASGSWAALGFATFTLIGVGSGLLIGGIFALLSSIIPKINIDLVKYPEKYHKQLKFIKIKTQEVLIEKYPKKVRQS